MGDRGVLDRLARVAPGGPPRWQAARGAVYKSTNCHPRDARCSSKRLSQALRWPRSLCAGVICRLKHPPADRCQPPAAGRWIAPVAPPTTGRPPPTDRHLPPAARHPPRPTESGLRARRPVPQPVERHVEDVVDLPGVGGGDLRDRRRRSGSPRRGRCPCARRPACLRALEERFAGGVQRGAAALEQIGVAVDVGQQLLGERLLRGHVGDEPVQPADERLPRRRVRRGRPPSGTAPPPRRRRRPRAAPGGSGSGGTACRSRPRRVARSPPATSMRRPRRTPRARRRSASRSCAARRPASGGCAAELIGVSGVAHEITRDSS